MSSWVEFMGALLAFFLSHAIPVRPPVRAWFVARLGLKGYVVGYSLLSTLLLVWTVTAALRAPHVPLLPAWDIWRWVPVVVMAPVCLLVVAGMRVQNPFSFGGFGRVPFDPDRPGVLAITRHPLLLALGLWAGAHALANGDLAMMILFGLFAGFAALGMTMVDRRKARQMPDWSRCARNTARFALRPWWPGFSTVLLAAALYVALLALHPVVIGMPVLI